MSYILFTDTLSVQAEKITRLEAERAALITALRKSAEMLEEASALSVDAFDKRIVQSWRTQAAENLRLAGKE